MLPQGMNNLTSPRMLQPYDAVEMKNIRLGRKKGHVVRRNGYVPIQHTLNPIYKILCGTYYEQANGLGYILLQAGDGDGDDDGVLYSYAIYVAGTVGFSGNEDSDVVTVDDTVRGAFAPQRGDYLYYSDAVSMHGYSAAVGGNTFTPGLTRYPGTLWTTSTSVYGHAQLAYYTYFITKWNEDRRVESLPQHMHKSFTGYEAGAFVQWYHQFQGLSNVLSGVVDIIRQGRGGSETFYSLTSSGTIPAVAGSEPNTHLRVYRALMADVNGRVVGSIFKARLVAEVTAITDFVDVKGDSELGELLTFSGTTMPAWTMATKWGSVYCYSGVASFKDRVYFSLPDAPENVPMDVSMGRTTASGSAGAAGDGSVTVTALTNVTTYGYQEGDYLWVKSGTNVTPGRYIIKTIVSATSVVLFTTCTDGGGAGSSIVWELSDADVLTRAQPIEGYFAEQWIPFTPRVTGIAGTNEGCVVGTPLATHIVTGSNVTNWRVSKLTDFGCLSPQAIHSTPVGVIWLSSEGLIWWNESNAPINVTANTIDLDSGNLNVLRSALNRAVGTYVKSENAYALVLPDSSGTYNKILWLYTGDAKPKFYYDDVSNSLSSGEEITAAWTVSLSNYPDFLMLGTTKGRVLYEDTSLIGAGAFNDNSASSASPSNTPVGLAVEFWTGQDELRKFPSGANIRIHTTGTDTHNLAVTCTGVKSQNISEGTAETLVVTTTEELPGSKKFRVHGNMYHWKITEATATTLEFTDIEVEHTGGQTSLRGED